MDTTLNQLLLRTRQTARFPRGNERDYLVIALAGEVGELANVHKKMLREGISPERSQAMLAQLIDELGDVLWYVAALADNLGVDLETVNVVNTEKLNLRNGINASSSSYDQSQ